MDSYAATLLENTKDPHILLAIMLVAACIVAAVAQRIGRPILLRLTAQIPMANQILRTADGAISYFLPLFLMQIVVRAAPDDLRGIDGLRHLLSVLLIISFTILLMRAVHGVAKAVTARYPLDVVDNLNARRIHTQTRVLLRTAMVIIVILGLSAVLMTFPSVRAIGASLLASAGVIGLAVGMAAKPVLGNLIAGMQIALTQPIRLDDVLIVEGEWGRVEEITGSYVVLNIWDRRRLIIPLQWFIEHPFQNWTRNSADIIGSIYWWVDYRMPLEPLRREIRRLCETSPQWWDGELALLQVTESGPQSMQIRAIVSAANSGNAWDLRCYVRAGVIDFIQREYPQYLPRQRAEIDAISELTGQSGRQEPPPPAPSSEAAAKKVESPAPGEDKAGKDRH